MSGSSHSKPAPPTIVGVTVKSQPTRDWYCAESADWASLRIDNEGEHSWLTTLRRNAARSSNSVTRATSTSLMLSTSSSPMSPGPSPTTCGPAMSISRCRLAALPRAAPTPTAMIRVPAPLMASAEATARAIVGAAASPRFVLTPTSGGGPGSNGSPGWSKSNAVGSPSVT